MMLNELRILLSRNLAEFTSDEIVVISCCTVLAVPIYRSSSIIIFCDIYQISSCNKDAFRVIMKTSLANYLYLPVDYS